MKENCLILVKNGTQGTFIVVSINIGETVTAVLRVFLFLPQFLSYFFLLS